MDFLLHTVAGKPDKMDGGAEECCVMTRAPRVMFVTLPRTKVYHPTLPASSGILWWHNADDATLTALHELCLGICAETGFAVVCAMCHAPAVPAFPFWREKLGESFGSLRWRT